MGGGGGGGFKFIDKSGKNGQNNNSSLSVFSLDDSYHFSLFHWIMKRSSCGCFMVLERTYTPVICSKQVNKDKTLNFFLQF